MHDQESKPISIQQLHDNIFSVRDSCHGMRKLGTLIPKFNSVVGKSFPSNRDFYSEAKFAIGF
jgi:hypothetical protein